MCAGVINFKLNNECGRALQDLVKIIHPVYFFLQGQKKNCRRNSFKKMKKKIFLLTIYFDIRLAFKNYSLW
jgi:hypothetical protein